MSAEFLEFNKKISIAKKTDVLVIGGGTAGCFAAIAAAKTGARVVLCEKNGILGGTMTASWVNFPGLFHAWGKQIIDGPCYEAVRRVLAIEGKSVPVFDFIPKHHWEQQIVLNRFVLATVLEQMCIENGVDLMLHSAFVSADEQNSFVNSFFSGTDKPFAVQAKTVIDASGNAAVCGSLGYEREKGEELQPSTLLHNLDGYDINSVKEEEFSAYVTNALEKGILKKDDFYGKNLYRQLRSKRISVHTAGDASEVCGRSAVEIKARETLLRLIGFFKTVPGLEKIFVSAFADECGIRETYRIVGKTKMTVDLYLSGYRYPDAVSYAFYPVDLHITHGIRQSFLEKDIIPTIPFGALVPEKSTRVFAVGRHISSDRDTNSAVRVQAPCMAMGQAAGVAAALCAKGRYIIDTLDYDNLVKELKKIGAVVPD